MLWANLHSRKGKKAKENAAQVRPGGVLEKSLNFDLTIIL
jgi:hypothetical protein